MNEHPVSVQAPVDQMVGEDQSNNLGDISSKKAEMMMATEALVIDNENSNTNNDDFEDLESCESSMVHV